MRTQQHSPKFVRSPMQRNSN
jgi:uncharacterized protein YijF (DUF1287 family)